MGRLQVLLLAGCMGLSPLVAQAADADGAAAGTIEELIVTAERTNRSLRDTATSVAVLTGADADALGAQSTYDLLDRIPNITGVRASNGAPAVRGIDGAGPAVGANAFFAGTRPRLNYLVDGRTLTFNEVIYLDGGIWDLQQFEVYRGPQSTLQGRNAVAGVIAIKTADPTFEWQGRARVAVGEYDARQVAAAVGGPLIADQLAFRLAGEFRRDDSYVRIRDTPYDHPRRSQSKSVRGKLLFTPSAAPGLRSLLTLSYADSYAPQSPTASRPFEDRRYGYANPPRFRTRATVAISDTSWQVSDDVRLSAFLTASDFRVNRYVTAGQGVAQIDGDEYTVEPRVTFGRKDGPVTGFLAAYLFKASQDEDIDLFGGGQYRDRTLTRAVFGELTWRPAPIVDVTVGARYEQEKRDRTGGAGPFGIDYHQTFEVFLPRATVAVRATEAVTLGATIGRGYNAGGAGFAFNPPFPSFTFGKETVWNYEAFARAAWLDGRLRVNGNIFYNDYSGLQLPFDVGNTPGFPATIIRNAEKATSYGAEVEARYAVSPRLDLFGAAGLLRTKVNRYSDPSVEGRKLPRSPAFSLSGGLTGRPVEGVELTFDARYTDSYYSDVFNNARGKTDPYVIANAQAAYRRGPARFYVSVINIFDRFEPTFYSLGPTAAADNAQVLPPRKLTAGVEFTF